jgi:diphthamide synthase (EF-2-diphthine--ammonia ligase)
MREARHIAFGDIFLRDVREYREQLAGRMGYEAVFPLWGESTRMLADQVIESGIVATIVCVDTEVMTADVAGRRFDATFVAALPAAIDPCGERGEFHTFVSFGPGFDAPVEFTVGETVVRDERFAFCDLLSGVTA